MDARSILIAEYWKESYEDMHYLLARMQKDLADYAAKEGANQKVVSIKKETISRINRFIDLTADLVSEQAKMLEKTGSSNYKNKLLIEENAILRAYAHSKGLDLSLIPYMRKKDFYP